jgi:myo-inositol 2-dehydrogenase/D-chiro-inositol 1-dehydrogenase
VKRPVKIGVAGLGRLGTIHARNIASRIRNAELSAICDSNPDILNRTLEQLEIENGFTSFTDMLEQADLDAICIVTPSSQHPLQIEQSLETGFHIFCEKPLGTAMEESIRAREAVLAHPDRIFMLGFMRRYDASYRYAKHVIDEGEIGRIVLFRGYSVDPVSSIGSVLPYIKHSAGQFLDMSVHDIDLARWMLKSEPRSIFAMGGCFAYPEFATFGDGDNVGALVQFENDAMAFLFAGRTAPHGYNVETEIIGTGGTLRIGSVPQKNLVEIMDRDGIRKECSRSFSERFEQAFVNEMQEFVDCILEERHPEVTVHDGIESTKIAELMTESFRKNILIKLDE